MIKKLIIATILSCSAFALQAQHLGLKAGLTLSNLKFEDVDDSNLRTGFHGGAYFYIPLTDFFALQPEVNFTTKGATAEYDVVSFQGEYSFNINYVDVPLMAALSLGDALEVHAGPYVGFLANTSLSTEGDFGDVEESLDSDNFKKLDYGLAGGLALNLGGLQVGARYHYGIQEVADSREAELFLGDARHSYVQVYGALRIGNID